MNNMGKQYSELIYVHIYIYKKKFFGVVASSSKHKKNAQAIRKQLN